MITEQSVQTPYKIAKDRRDLAIYRDYQELIQRPGAMPAAVDAIIMEKYTIHSRATVWSTRKRVAKRLAKEGKQDV